jgi:hypothetical protein
MCIYSIFIAVTMGLLSLKHEKKYNCDNTIEMVQYIQIEKEFDYV